MNPIKLISSFVLFFIFYFLFFISAAQAAVICQPIYGGGETCVQAENIKADKKVLNPLNNAFVDNLTLDMTNSRYTPNDRIVFQLSITNTGSATINNIAVEDIFPQFVDFAAGPGNYDSKTRTLSLALPDVKQNETRVINIAGNIVASDKFPLEKGVTCMVNQLVASVKDTGSSSDNAQFCVETGKASIVTKGGVSVFPAPVTSKTPATGPELLFLIALLPSGIIGYFLRKKAI